MIGKNMYRLRLKKLDFSSSNKKKKKKLNFLGEVTYAENIKADRPKILKPTHFSCMKDFKAEKLVVGVIP
jgi:hypothetical protein